MLLLLPQMRDFVDSELFVEVLQKLVLMRDFQYHKMQLDVEESGLGKMFGNAMSGANFEISDKQMKAT